METVSVVTDSDPDTWELIQGTRVLPASTTHLELQIHALNSDIDPTDGFFVDDASVILEPNLVTDGGFEFPTLLHAFFRTAGNPWQPGEWNVEDADIVETAAGRVPKNGTRMLRVNNTSGTHSQVNQIIDLAGPVGDGNTIGTWSVCVDATVATPISLRLRAAPTRNPDVGTLTGVTLQEVETLTTDAAAGWEEITLVRFLPQGTNFLEIEIFALNADINGDGFFVDCASVIPGINRLTDHSFEPATALHAFARASGDPWIPGEWNAEDASVVSGPVDGVSPLSGTEMLQINQTGGVTSQVNQIIAIPGHSVFASGTARADFGLWANGANTATPITVRLRTSASRNVNVGTLSPPVTEEIVTLTTGVEPGEWELLEGSLALPAGSNWLELQVSAPNASIDPTDGFLVDLGRVTLVRCKYVFVLVETLPLMGEGGIALVGVLLALGGVVALKRRRPRGLP